MPNAGNPAQALDELELRRDGGIEPAHSTSVSGERHQRHAERHVAHEAVTLAVAVADEEQQQRPDDREPDDDQRETAIRSRSLSPDVVGEDQHDAQERRRRIGATEPLCSSRSTALTAATTCAGAVDRAVDDSASTPRHSHSSAADLIGCTMAAS